MFVQLKLPLILSSLKRHNLCISVVFFVLIIHEFGGFSVVCCWAACFTFITIGRLLRHLTLLFILLVKSHETPYLPLKDVGFCFSRWERGNQCRKLTDTGVFGGKRFPFLVLEKHREVYKGAGSPVVSALLLYFMVCEIDLFHFISHSVESAALKSNLPLLKHRLN